MTFHQQMNLHNHYGTSVVHVQYRQNHFPLHYGSNRGYDFKLLLVFVTTRQRSNVTAAGCSAALPFHSSDPDPDARTSRDDLRPSPVTKTRSLLPTGEDRQVMHLSTSYTPNFPRQTAVLSDIKAYGQTSSSCSCSATCASSGRASTNAGEQDLYNIHATGILVHATSSTDATETSTPERNLGTSIRYCLVKGFWRERQRHSLQQTISGRERLRGSGTPNGNWLMRQ